MNQASSCCWCVIGVAIRSSLFRLGVDGNSSSKRMPPPSGVPAEFDSDWPFAGIHAGTPFSIPAQTRRLYAAMLSFCILENQTVIGAEPALLPE
jgi:hypothetical protein